MSPTRSVTILHVDDEPEFGDLVQTILPKERETFDVVTTTNPRDVLSYLDANDIDCVVSDYDMPKSNGLELLETVREEYPDLPFILFTGKGTEKVASKAISAGVTDYLQKEPGKDQFTLLANRIENAIKSNEHQQKVAEMNRRFQAVLETMTAAVFLKNANGRYLLVNDAFRDLFGMDSDKDITGVTDKDLFPQERIEKYQEDDMQVLQTGEMVETIEQVPTDTGRQTHLTRKSPVYDEHGEINAICGVTTDITEQKKREETIRTLKERFELAVEGANLGVWDWDMTTDAVEFNEQWATMLGYSIEDIEPTLDAWERRVHPADLPPVEDALEAHKNGETRYYDTEHRMRTASGEWKWIRDIGQIFERGEDGTPKRAVGIHIDIDDRKRAKQALKEERDLFTRGPVVVFRWEETAQWPINYVSSNVTEVLGYESGAFLSGTIQFADIIHEDDRSRVLTEWQQKDQRTDSFAFEPYRVRTKEGEVRWVLCQTIKPDTDEISEQIGYIIDITEQRKTKQELDKYATTFDELQETMRKLLRATEPEEAARVVINSLETVFEFDVAGVWLSTESGSRLEPIAITNRGKKLIEEPPTYSSETQSLSWDAYVNQQTRKIDDMSVHEERHNPQSPIQSELIVPLGEYGILNIGSETKAAFRTEDANRIGIWADTVTSALARLDQIQQLKTRESELQRERDRLDEFAGFVSHDLRNPLSTASLHVELAADDCDNPHLKDTQQVLDRMEELIDDLLALAQQGDSIGETEPVQLKALISQCWNNTEASNAKIDIKTDAMINADRSRLASLLENLFRNAIDYGGEGVTITVDTLSDERGFYVADDGHGIPEDTRNQIFESGYSTDNESTGFGLAIVEQIADAHGWNISVTESETGGARFDITDVVFSSE